jgi:hypothetical protein
VVYASGNRSRETRTVRDIHVKDWQEKRRFERNSQRGRKKTGVYGVIEAKETKGFQVQNKPVKFIKHLSVNTKC